MSQAMLLHFLAMAGLISLVAAACLALVDLAKGGVRYLVTEDRLMRIAWFAVSGLLAVQYHLSV
mgnify:CR=1 FL=1